MPFGFTGGRKSCIDLYLLAIAMLTVGVSWLPIFRVYGINIEVDNFGSILVIFISAFQVLLGQKKLKLAPIFMLFALWLSWMAIIMLIHTGMQGFYVLRQWFVGVVFVFLLSNYDANILSSLRTIASFSVLALAGIFMLSSYLANIDFMGDTLRFLVAQNRDYYYHNTIREILNAFVAPGDRGPLSEYTTVQVNKISSAFAVYYSIILLSQNRESMVMRTLGIISLVISAVFLLLLFSSSGVLMLLFATIIYLWRVLRYAKIYSLVGLITLLFFLIVIVGYNFGGGIVEYLSNQVDSDAKSREGRLLQYSHVWSLLSKSGLIGMGYKTFDGLPVHNWILFSWISSGVIGLVFSISIYLEIIRYLMCIYTGQRGNKIGYFYLGVALTFVFFLRTMVGGGGGVASGAGMLSLALVLLLYQASNDKNSKFFYS